MELRTLKILVAIADHGGFAAAGDAIGLTQSAISQQVKHLEQELDAVLFDRSKRPPTLNARGRNIVLRARDVLGLCEEIKQSASISPASGILKLGAVPSVSSGVLPGVLLKLRETQPALQVDLFSGLSDEMTRRVIRNELDAAIVTQPEILRSGLIWLPCMEEPIVLIAHRSVQENNYRDILANHPFIRFQRYTWAGQLIDSHIRQEALHIRSNMEMDSLETIVEMVAHGLGVAVVPKRNLRKPFPDNVRSLPFGATPIKRSIGIIERSSNPKSRFVTAVREILLIERKTGRAPDPVASSPIG